MLTFILTDVLCKEAFNVCVFFFVYTEVLKRPNIILLCACELDLHEHMFQVHYRRHIACTGSLQTRGAKLSRNLDRCEKAAYRPRRTLTFTFFFGLCSCGLCSETAQWNFHITETTR